VGRYPARICGYRSQNIKAIVPVHVFGYACEVDSIDTIAQRHNLKVIYDAAHAFGVTYRGESLLTWGDASTLSFHATKLFHSVEGGAIVFKRKEDLEIAKKIINFGITGPDTIEELGINAKMNELQAAMGLCVLDEIEKIGKTRRAVTATYDQYLEGAIQKQQIQSELTYNHAYYPVALKNEEQLTRVMYSLRDAGVMTRRYFYPSLESLGFLSKDVKECPESNKLARRILCLPIYSTLEKADCVMIAGKVLEAACEKPIA
jgi:dTDP-4-amino-4,6-dideoxygalactose transaminase